MVCVITPESTRTGSGSHWEGFPVLSDVMSATHKNVSVRGDSETVAPEPSGKTVRRLAVEAGKYAGVEAGGSLPLHELRQQAVANGYANDEITQLLADAGVRHADAVTVPEPGDLFGELWRVESDAGVPTPNTQTDAQDAVERFREWLQDKADDDATGHSYSRRTANRRYVRGKDVDRQFTDEYEVFSTVLITFCRPRSDDESIPEHAGRFYPRSVVGKRRRVLKGLDVYDEYAGVSVLAPKHGPKGGAEHREHRVPHPNAQTHAHDFLWIPGTVSESDFEGLASVTDADVHVSVETHRSSDVSTPDCVADRGDDMDSTRGATTALPHELGNNIPLLQTRLDARGLPRYAEHWCAQMRLGADDSLGTKGVHRVRTHGRFDVLADAEKWGRRVREGATVGTALARRFE